METFGETLRTIIERRKVNKSLLCDSLGISRSLFYRYLSDKAVMDDDMLNLLVRELMMLPAEIIELQEAHAATKVGMDRYKCRLIVERIINDLTMCSKKCSTVNIDETFVSSILEKQMKVFTGYENVRMVLRYILKNIGKTEETEQVYVLAQPSDDMVMGEISECLSTNTGNYIINHCFRLYQNIDKQTSTLASNLEVQSKVFENLFPIIKAKHYRPAYFYEYYTSSLKTIFSLQMFRMLTDKYVLFIFDGNEKAIFFSDPEIISIYNDELVTHYNNSLVYLEQVDYTKRSANQRLAEASQSGVFSLSDVPWIFFAMASIFIENKVSTPGVLKNDWIQTLRDRNIEAIKNGMQIYACFTLSGLTRFVKTGVFATLPETALKPLSPAQIRRYLEDVYNCFVQYKNAIPILADENKISLFGNTTIRINNDSEIRLIDNNLGVNKAYVITEKSIVKAFSDYLFTEFSNRIPSDSKKNALDALKAAMDSIPN